MKGFVTACSALCLCLGTSCTLIQYRVEKESLVEEITELDQRGSDMGAAQPIVKNRAEALMRFGPPHKFGSLEDGRYVFGYEYRNVTERQIGFSIPEYSLFKVGAGRTGAGRYTLLIEFSEDGQVLAVGAANWQEDVGFGFNFQLFFAVAPTSDSRGILERWNTEAWATDLLHSPIAIVDLSHDLDAGDAGLRFSGMPKPEKQFPSMRTGKR